MERVLNAGDAYYSPNRAVYEYELVDTTELDPVTGEPIPFDMSGSTIYATFKEGPTARDEDPIDASAPLTADITFAANGDIVPTPKNWELPPGNTAVHGVLHLSADKVTTAGLPLNTSLQSDIRVVDALGRPHTVRLVGTLKVIPTITNRS